MKKPSLSVITQLAFAGEGLHVEFKTRMPQPEKIAREVIALANTAGGKVLIGVTDEGIVAGVKDVSGEVYELQNALEEFCRPAVDIQIDIVAVTRRRDVIAVSVPQSATAPHYILQDDQRKLVFVRVDDQSIVASREMIRILKAKHQPKDTHFQFGDKEVKLMTYLETYGHITVNGMKRLSQVTRKSASQTLVLLVRAGILDIQPAEGEDRYVRSAQVNI